MILNREFLVINDDYTASILIQLKNILLKR